MSTTINHAVERATPMLARWTTPTIRTPRSSKRAREDRPYSAKYKARILDEYERLDKAGKGASVAP